MTPYKKRLNKYIGRMAEDMQVRNFAEATIDAYTYHVDKFCQHFGKQADQLGPEQIRQYQLYLRGGASLGSYAGFGIAVMAETRFPRLTRSMTPLLDILSPVA